MALHRLRKISVLLLVAAAVVVGSPFVGPVAGAASGRAVAGAANRDNVHAVWPILPHATRSELAVIRKVEAREAAAMAYDPSAAAYSVAALNGYTSGGK
jgi:hypothetical protein